MANSSTGVFRRDPAEFIRVFIPKPSPVATLTLPPPPPTFNAAWMVNQTVTIQPAIQTQ